jgi:hypothetical protein
LIREAKLVIADTIDVAFVDALGFDTLTRELDSIRAAQVFHEVRAIVKHDRRMPSRNVSIANREICASRTSANDKLVFFDWKGLAVELKHQDSATHCVGRPTSRKRRRRGHARLRRRAA